MECHCKIYGVPVCCDVENPSCGKAKFKPRMEHFIMSTCLGGIIDVLAVIVIISILGGMIAGIAWCFNHLK